MNLNNKQQKILELIFTNPVPANIIWQDIENLFIALGADVSQGLPPHELNLASRVYTPLSRII
ncbi:MAG: hypothetical protein ACKN9K_26385 [Dolichospermum sp.]